MKNKFIALAIFIFVWINTVAQNSTNKFITAFNGIKIWQLGNNKSFYFFQSKMSIDADGSPRAYHPQNKGLDNLKNAGRKGNWRGIVTYKSGVPYIQNNNDPNPGYYVSTTSLCKPYYSIFSPHKYINAEKIPYIALPLSFSKKMGTKLGDLVYVYNTLTKRGCCAIFADIGPKGKLGEGSIYLAKQIGVNSNPRIGGQAKGIVYIVFKNSKLKQNYTLDNIKRQTNALIKTKQIHRVIHQCYN